MLSTKLRGASRSFVTVIDNRNRKFLFCDLMHDRLYGASSADVCLLAHVPSQTSQAAAQAIRTIKPSQVMLEIDEQRYQAAIASIVKDEAMSAPSRVDIISTVHGGLMTREMKAAVEAAKEIDADIYLVDRPYRITQNRLAEKVLNPYVFANMFNYGKMSLMNRANHTVADLEKFLKSEAPPIYKVLVEERAQYMARLIHEHAKNDETAVIVCSQLHVPLIREILSAPDVDERVAKIKMAEISRKGLPLWPILVFVYFVIPVGTVGYAWSFLVGGLVGALKQLFLS